MTIDELQVLVTANSTQFQKEMGEVQRELKKLTKQAEDTGDRIPKSFTKAGAGAVALGNIITKVVTSAFRALSNSMGGAIDRLDTIKNYPRVMSALGFSTEDAERSVKILSDRLLGLPTSLNEMVNATQQLATVSPTLASATERALALNNAFLAGGQGAEASRRGLVQFNQMLATGKADMQSWKILMEVMPGQLKQLSQSLLGASANGITLQDAIQNGEVSMQQLADEVVKLNKKGIDGFGSFEQQARNATGGIGTSITNVKIAIQRGLADVMDAIGQANIAGFFNAVSNAIGAVIPYIVAFTQVAMQAVSWLGALFGFGGGGKSEAMKKDVESTASSMGGVASSANDAGGAIGGASKKAKELKKQLAGFDEMNVLSEDKGSSGGGGGGGASAGGGGNAIEFPEPKTGKLESAKDKVQAIIKKIKDAFKTFVNSPFVKGFMDVFEVLADVGKAVFENVLKPIGSLVFDAVVGFFQAVGENSTAMQILGTVVGALVASFALVNVAMGIWTAITVVATAVGTAFGAVMAFITSPIGLVILAIAGIIAIVVLLVKNWDKVSEVAKNVWTKIKEIWGVVANWFKENIVQPIIDFFKGLWQWIKDHGVKLLLVITAPWLLAVKFIIDNFDKIKAFASKLWNGIKSIFSGIGRWFGDKFSQAYQSVKNAFGAVIGFFGGLWGKIKSKFSSIGSAIGDAIGGAFKTVVNSILGFAENTINGFIRAINTAIGAINKIPGVSISTISELSIPRLAKGGIIDQATLAVVGESGKEAVVPLENNTGWIDMIAQKMSNAGGGGQPIHLTVKVGEETLVKKVLEGAKDQAFMTNTEVFI